MELTYKQRLFVAYYLGESKGNASDAARRAGYGSPGTRGHELVKKREIRAAIDAAVTSAAMPADEVLARISDQASGSLGDFLDIDENGHHINLLKAKKRGRLGVLKKIKVKRTTTMIRDVETETVETEIEIRDPSPALFKLGDHFGLFKSATGGNLDEPSAQDDQGEISPQL